ncbi:GNAT family acetyltransferase [Penicillium riverlandense]|uniref:GNAT family acetyltransferase n=1 Tax=Penicillium riverlandense TaxID=1903569 RepID=UPI00254749FF|nr:GNAT family acetyltransferase [Penicillium riverlandense]KAJ5833820.1 GNAT family acetyltransferase [Penicillium riverlandense]
MAATIPESAIYKPFHSQRLFFRALEENEKDEAFFCKLCLEPQVMFMASPVPTVPMSAASIKELRKEFAKDSLLMVLICKQPESADKEPEPIGLTNLRNNKFMHSRNAELGIMIMPEHQGKGYGPEAISWILDWGFTEQGLHRIELGTYELNERAQKAYVGMGWVVEGRKREALFKAGRFWDVIIMGILAAEWKEKKRAAN